MKVTEFPSSSFPYLWKGKGNISLEAIFSLCIVFKSAGLDFSVVLCHCWGEMWRLLLVISVTLKMYPLSPRSTVIRGQASHPRPRFDPLLVDPLAIVVIDQDIKPLQVLDQEWLSLLSSPSLLSLYASENFVEMDFASDSAQFEVAESRCRKNGPSEAAIEDAANDRVTTMFDDMGAYFNVPIGVVLEEMKAKNKEEKLQKTVEDDELKKKNKKVEAIPAKKMESTKKAKRLY
ncbi:hypothetical protein AMTR_s00150p00085710 [Amborella trichopoda]|uniref:Uncharacterized protein n=1 Tax=Amborella trichopoda TaxID=13333 RepID=W1PMR2_AMBTC|nr:hypothetical protein AMTR_s00150p00085710 [Amborella trichopoda]